MIWTDWTSIIGFLANQVTAASIIADGVQIVTLPNSYTITVLDMLCAFIVFDEVYDFVDGLR